jgi:hypothetical protein
MEESQKKQRSDVLAAAVAALSKSCQADAARRLGVWETSRKPVLHVLEEALLNRPAQSRSCAFGFERASTRVVRESLQDVYSVLCEALEC